METDDPIVHCVKCAPLVQVPQAPVVRFARLPDKFKELPRIVYGSRFSAPHEEKRPRRRSNSLARQIK